MNDNTWHQQVHTNSLLLMIGWLLIAASINVLSEWILPVFGSILIGLWFVVLLVPLRLSNESMVQSRRREIIHNWRTLLGYVFLYPLLAIIISGMTVTICRYQLYLEFGADVWRSKCQQEDLWRQATFLLVPYLLGWAIMLMGFLAKTRSDAAQKAQRWEKFYGRFDNLAIHLGYGTLLLFIVSIVMIIRPESFLLIGCVAMFPLSLLAGLYLPARWYTPFVQIVYNFLTVLITLPSIWYGIWWVMNLVSTPTSELQNLFNTYPILEFGVLIGATSVIPVVLLTIYRLASSRR